MLIVEVVGLEPTCSEETRFTVWQANQLLNTSKLETRMRFELIKNRFAICRLKPFSHLVLLEIAIGLAHFISTFLIGIRECFAFRTYNQGLNRSTLFH